MMMDTITIRLNKEESQTFKEYAALNDMPLSTLFKKTLEEKMEDEFDMQVIAAYENENSHKIYTHEELKDMLDL
jgi:hypothetical protein